MKSFEGIELLKKAYNKSLSQVNQKYKLTLNEIKILMFLYEDNSNDFAKDIVEGLGAAKSHISVSVSNLEKNGYIIKIQDEKDKKKFHLNITDKAKKIVEEAKVEQNKLKTMLTDGITIEEYEVMKKVFKKLKDNLEKYNSFGG